MKGMVMAPLRLATALLLGFLAILLLLIRTDSHYGAFGSVSAQLSNIPMTGPSVPGGPDALRQAHARARTVTAAQTGPADNLEEFQALQPLGYTVNTSLVGIAESTPGIDVKPDTIIARSPARVLEATNAGLMLWDSPTDTTPERVALESFFPFVQSPCPVNNFLFDPKVFYDRNAPNRFYIIALRGTGDTCYDDPVPHSRIHLAVSRSSDPPNLTVSSWCFYELEGRRNIGTSLESFADFPGLGVGADALVITTNQHNPRSYGFTFAVVRVLNKLILSNNAGACPPLPMVHDFQPATQPNDPTIWTLQPVQHYTSPSSVRNFQNPVYLVSADWAYAPDGQSDVYHIWRVSNVATGSPDFTSKPTNVRGNYLYLTPPNAQERDRTDPQWGDYLLTATSGVYQAAGIGDALYAVHSTACNFDGGEAESCVRIVRILVSMGPGGHLTASLDQQHTIGGGSGVFYWDGGIAVNTNHHEGVVFLRSSSSTYLSAYWTAKSLSASSFEPSAALSDGICSRLYSSGAHTGDYTGAQSDPTGTSFWLAGERHTLISGICVWETHIIQVTPP